MDSISERKMETSEKRGKRRFNLSLPASISSIEGEKETTFQAHTLNINSLGVYVVTNKLFAINSQVQINLAFSPETMDKLNEDASNLLLKGYVVRSEKKGLAVRLYSSQDNK